MGHNVNMADSGLFELPVSLDLNIISGYACASAQVTLQDPAYAAWLMPLSQANAAQALLRSQS